MQKQPTSSGRIAIPLPWETVTGSRIYEADLLDDLTQLPREPLLSHLIKVLQYLDVPVHPSKLDMDGLIQDLFPCALGRRTDALRRISNRFIFFSQWQLLLAIKLLCTFGSDSSVENEFNPEQALRLLLRVNSFYPDRPDSPYLQGEDPVKQVQSVALRGYALPSYERPSDLIVRYATMFSELGAPANESTFNTWLNVKDVLAEKMGFDIEVFKAVMFAIFGSTIPTYDGEGDGFPFGRLDPATYFARTQLPSHEVGAILDLVTVAPDQIKESHLTAYGDNIGNPVDLGLLVRKPVLRLHDGMLAGMSGELVVQRCTSGLYWDINDALPSNVNSRPNRAQFWTFFGELHERYGRDVLRRIVERQRQYGKETKLLSDLDYGAGHGHNPDNLVIETIGPSDAYATLFEFKVGRPKFKESIVKGDVESFYEDLKEKIEHGLIQEIDLFRPLVSGKRSIVGMSADNVSKWFFVIVVTDPSPATGLFLAPLRQKLIDAEPDEGPELFGPFILCLSELEQLEALSDERLSNLLTGWWNGPDKEWPFNTFFFSLTQGQPLKFDRMAESAAMELQKAKRLIGAGHSN